MDFKEMQEEEDKLFQMVEEAKREEEERFFQMVKEVRSFNLLRKEYSDAEGEVADFFAQEDTQIVEVFNIIQRCCENDWGVSEKVIIKRMYDYCSVKKLRKMLRILELKKFVLQVDDRWSIYRRDEKAKQISVF